MSLLERFTRVARDRADEVLVWAPQEGRASRAADLLAEAHAMARGLSDAGLEPGQAVLATVGNQTSFITLTLACLSRSWPLLAADRNTPSAEVQALVRRWRPAAWVGVDAPASPGPPATAVPLLPGLEARVFAQSDPGRRYGDAVLLKLTSGSTGTPKLTLTEERHLMADVSQIVEGMQIGPRTRQLGVIPLSHSYGFSNLVLPLLWQGSPLLLHPGFVPAHVAADATAFGAETWAGVPYMFEHVARHVTAPFPPTMRRVISAGAPLPVEVVRAFHARTGRKVHSFYGSSETGGICYDDSDEIDEDVSVGRPLGATQVQLLEDGDAPDGSGRVAVRGPAVVDGYADGADVEAFAGGAFITGDFGRFDARGRLWLTGRAAAAVNVAGRKVLPLEVETAIRAVPGVRDVAVIGVEDARRGQTLGACFVAADAIPPHVLRSALASRLASYKLPRVIVQVDTLPRTARGKPDRQAVARLLDEARAAGDVVVSAPRADR